MSNNADNDTQRSVIAVAALFVFCAYVMISSEALWPKIIGFALGVCNGLLSNIAGIFKIKKQGAYNMVLRIAEISPLFVVVAVAVLWPSAAMGVLLGTGFGVLFDWSHCLKLRK